VPPSSFPFPRESVVVVVETGDRGVVRWVSGCEDLVEVALFSGSVVEVEPEGLQAAPARSCDCCGESAEPMVLGGYASDPINVCPSCAALPTLPLE
jgi:hypothetical protein